MKKLLIGLAAFLTVVPLSHAFPFTGYVQISSGPKQSGGFNVQTSTITKLCFDDGSCEATAGGGQTGVVFLSPSSQQFGNVNVTSATMVNLKTSGSVQIGNLTGYPNNCVQADINGNVSGTGAACGTGSGGGNAIYPATGTPDFPFGLQVSTIQTSTITLQNAIYDQNTGSRIFSVSGSGNANLFAGVNAGTTTLTGLGHTGIGYQALQHLTSGSSNSSFGASTLSGDTTGSSNSGFGDNSLFGLTTGSGNTAYGYDSGYNHNTTAGVISGSSNTFVGFEAGTTNSSLVNGVAIGANSVVTANNTAVIGGAPGTYNTMNLIVSSVTVPSLSANQCVQTSAGGLLTTTGSSCSAGGGGSSSLQVTSNGVQITSPTSSMNFGTQFSLAAVSSTSTIALNSNLVISTLTAGNIYINTTNPLQSLDIRNSGGYLATWGAVGNDFGHLGQSTNWSYFTGAANKGIGFGGNGNTTDLYVSSNDFIGIGNVTTPTEWLDVNGNIRIRGTYLKFPDGTTQTTAATGSGGAGMSSQLGDFGLVTLNASSQTIGANCTTATPCQIRNGPVVYSLTSSATVTVTGTVTSGNVYWYLTSGDVLTVGHNTTATVTCLGGACAVATGVTGFPVDSVPLWISSFTSNAWNTVVESMDQRAVYSHNVNTPGSGLASTDDPTTGIRTWTTDSTIVPRYFTGASTPTITCAQGRDFYTETTTSQTWVCGGTGNTWEGPLSTSTSGGGSGTPGGVNTQIQYNNAGSFAGIPGSVVGTSSVTIGALSVTTSTVVSAGSVFVTISSGIGGSSLLTLDTNGNEVITGSMTVKQASFSGNGNLSFTNNGNASSYQVVGSSTSPTTGHLAVWSSSWSVIDGGVASATTLPNPYTYSGSSFTMVSSFSVTTNGLQNVTPGLSDVYDGNAYSGKPLASWGTQNGNNQVVFQDQKPAQFDLYGAQLGSIKTGGTSSGNQHQFWDANSFQQTINLWNSGEMDLQTANVGDGGTNTNAIVFKPNEVSEMVVSSLSVTITTGTTITTSAGTQGSLAGVLSLNMTNAAWNEPGLYISHTSNTSNNNSDILVDDGFTPAITIRETSQVNPSAEKWQFSAHNGVFRLENRLNSDSGFGPWMQVSSATFFNDIYVGSTYGNQNNDTQFQVQGSTNNVYVTSFSTSAATGSYSVTVSTNGALGLMPLTHATIATIVPNKLGQEYDCSDCSTVPVCISTGTAVGAFSLITSKTTACN